MADSDDQDGELLMHSFVDNSVATNSEPSQAGKLALENRSGEGLCGQTIDRRDETMSVLR